MSRLENKRFKNSAHLLAAFGATAVLLSVIQPPWEFSALAWIAFVPLLVVCSPQEKARRLALVGYIVCLLYWLGNLGWLVPVTIAGWLVFCVYTAVLWPVLALSVRWCRGKGVPLFVAAPVLIVGIERLQGFGLGGFLWRLLGHSQYRNTEIIQISDIFGAGGVSFLVAMVNGIVAEWITVLISRMKEADEGPGKIRYGRMGAMTATVICGVVAAFIYGRWRIGQTAQCVVTGPTAAALQSNVPQSVKSASESSEKLFADLMAQSEAAASAGAELIVWPETMVQATLNPSILALPLLDSNLTKVFDKALREHAKDNAYLLIGSYGGTPKIQDESSFYLAERFNSAFLYRPDGTQSPESYSKIHLVPFGEVLPLRKTLPWFYEMLMKMEFIPYHYDYSLDYGTDYTVFKMTDDEGRNWRFSVMICYEDVTPYIAREFALDEHGKKQIHWLLNISNDGWFVVFDDEEQVRPSSELQQHAALCVFRAVENRLAVVRSVNTGISCVIDTLGNIRDDFRAGTLPERAMARTGMPGWLVDTIPIDHRTTFFSKYGPWLDFLCQLCVGSLIIMAILVRFTEHRKRKAHLPRKSDEKHLSRRSVKKSK